MTSTAQSLPTKGGDAVEILKNDHTLIKKMLTDLAAATDKESREEILEKAKPVLTVHNATEENLVYPALEKIAVQKRESQHLYKETAEADVLVFELDTMLKTGDDAAFGKTAAKLRDAVFEHIQDEESSAFPELQKKASPEQTKLLTKAVREFRKGFVFQPSAIKGHA
jgi:hemerythrin superfamily protein